MGRACYPRERSRRSRGDRGPRHACSMREHFEVPPERLGRWLERWADEHAPVERTEVRRERVTFAGSDGPVRAPPPFPPLTAVGDRAGFDPGPLLDHVTRDRVVGVVLVRLGGYAVGVF